MKRSVLTSSQLTQALNLLPKWSANHQMTSIRRQLQFKDFEQTFGFMTLIALRAEKLNHHPNWYNVYNQLQIDLTTHDLNGISTTDIELATYINEMAELYDTSSEKDKPSK